MKLTTREKPILFSGQMVRAILGGRKTQTRRVIKPQPNKGFHVLRDIPGENRWYVAYVHQQSEHSIEYRPVGSDEQHDWKCPYRVGDLLWVKEGVWCYEHTGWTKSHQLRWPKFDNHEAAKRWFDSTCSYAIDNPTPLDNPLGMPNKLFMPRWASRIDLRVTDVRAERLQDITESDAADEGFEHREHFIRYWDTLQKPGNRFDDNPYVWAVTFERHK